jgi:Acetyltransferase (GNAT) domain
MSSDVVISADLAQAHAMRAGSVAGPGAGSGPGSSDIFGTLGWLAAWDRTTVGEVVQRRYLAAVADDGSDVLAPLYLVAASLMWRGYEQEAGVCATWDKPVAYLPSMYSFRGPFEQSNLRAAPFAIDAARIHVEESGAQALVVANLSSDVALSVSELRRAEISMRLDTNFCLTLPPTIEAYFASLKRDHRADLRRRWRRATERGVVFRELEGGDVLGRLPAFVTLANASVVKHGIEPFYDLATFQALADAPGARLLLAERDGEMLAGFYAFVSDDCLTLWSGGILYAALRECSPYVFLLYEIVSLAYERGWRSVDFGRGNGGFKTRQSCTPTDLWTLVYLTDPADAEVVARLRALDERLQAAS